MNYEPLSEEEPMTLTLTKDHSKKRFVVSSSANTIRSIQNYWQYATTHQEHFYITFTSHPRIDFSWKMYETHTVGSYYRTHIQSHINGSKRPYISILFHPVAIKIYVYVLGTWIALEKKIALKWNFSSKKEASLSLIMENAG